MITTDLPPYTGLCEMSTPVHAGTIVGTLVVCLLVVTLFACNVLLITTYIKMARRRQRLLRITQVIIIKFDKDSELVISNRA